MADWSDLPYDTGDYDYPAQCQSQRSRMQDIATEVENGRIGEVTLSAIMTSIQTEVVDGREAESDLVSNIQTYYTNASGDPLSINNQRIINSVDGAVAFDGVTLQQAVSINGGGGDVSYITITSLSDTISTEGNRYIVGIGNPSSEANYILTCNVLGVSADEVVINSGGTLASGALKDIGSGDIPALSLLQAKISGDGLEEYNSDGIDSAVTMYISTTY